MSRSLSLYGGPLDGDTFEVPADMSTETGETFTVEGNRYRIGRAGSVAHFDPTGKGYALQAAAYTEGEAERGARLNLAEAVEALLLGATLGLSAGLSLVLMTLLGSWLRGLAGGFLNMALWATGIAAVAFAIAALRRPAIVRDK